MDIIILNDGLYSLVPVTKNMLEGITLVSGIDFYELCDLLRLKLTEYHTKLNIYTMNNGMGNWMGCIGK
jgi:hypothetical protein